MKWLTGHIYIIYTPIIEIESIHTCIYMYVINNSVDWQLSWGLTAFLDLSLLYMYCISWCIFNVICIYVYLDLWTT